MPTTTIVETFNIGEDVAQGLSASAIVTMMNQFCLERAEEAFFVVIIETVFGVAHAGPDPATVQQGLIGISCILTATVGVVDEASG